MTGFGETGPEQQAHRLRPGRAGGGRRHEASPASRHSPPVRAAACPIGDLGGGVFGAMGVLAALPGPRAHRPRPARRRLDARCADLAAQLHGDDAPDVRPGFPQRHRQRALRPRAVQHLSAPPTAGSSSPASAMPSSSASSGRRPPRSCASREYLQQPARFADRDRNDAVIGEELRAEHVSATGSTSCREARIPCRSRSTISGRRCPTRRCSLAQHGGRGAARGRRLGARAGQPDQVLRVRPGRHRPPRRASARTRTRCSPRWATTRRACTRSPPPARLPDPPRWNSSSSPMSPPATGCRASRWRSRPTPRWRSSRACSPPA